MLLVWLPMDGKIENKGLLVPYAPSSINAVSAVTEGVFGSSYKFYDSGLTYIRFNTSVAIQETMNNHSFSVCAWIKTDKNRCWLSITYAFRFWVKNQYIPGNSVTDTTNRAMDGKWHHVCTTHDNSTLKTCYYIDGILSVSGQSSTPASTTYTNATDIGHDVNNGSNPGHFFDGNICDVRIYNHCLSAKEVSELANGLSVHYKFDDEYTEGTTNALGTKSTHFAGVWGTYGFGSRALITSADIPPAINGEVALVTNKTSATTNVAVEMATNFSITGLVSGETVTCSAYLKGNGSTVGKKVNLHIYFNSACGATSTGKQFILGEDWKREEYTYTWNKPVSANSPNFYIVGYMMSGESFYASNAQVERKNHATPFTESTRQGLDKIIDCSGRGFDGIVTNPSGLKIVSTGVPRYKSALFIPSATTISHPMSLMNGTEQEWTCCAWIYPTILPNASLLNNMNQYNRLKHGTYPLLYLNSGNNDYYRYGNKVIELNKWQHIAFVFRNSDGLRNVYVDGVLTNGTGPNATSTPYGLPANTTLFGGNFEGYVSDYREYARALTDEQIKDLVKWGASVDNYGNIFTYEIIEE